MARRGGALALGMAVALSVVVPTTMAQAATINVDAEMVGLSIYTQTGPGSDALTIAPDTATIRVNLPDDFGALQGVSELHWAIEGSSFEEFVVPFSAVTVSGTQVVLSVDSASVFSSTVPSHESEDGDPYYDLVIVSEAYSDPGYGPDFADDWMTYSSQIALDLDESASSSEVEFTVSTTNAEESVYDAEYSFKVPGDEVATVAPSDIVRVHADGFDWQDGPLGNFEQNERYNQAWLCCELYFSDILGWWPDRIPIDEPTFSGGVVEVQLPSSVPEEYREYPNPGLSIESRGTARSLQISVSIEHSESAPELSKWKKVGTPTVSGAKVGGVATVKTGSWSPAPTSFEYQWMLDGVEIVDANDATYEPEVADFGKSLSVKVTAKRAGYADQLRVSKAVKVAAGTFTAATPTLSGDTQVGDTLTVDEGVWDPAAEFAYTWLRSGKTIKGATGDSYTLTSADRGKTIQVKVTGSAEGYKSASKTSAKTAKVGYGTLEGGTLSLTGDGIVEATLTASLTGVNPVPSKVTYQWYVNGKAIKGATKADFVVPGSALFGHITVEAKASLAGYTTKQFVVNPGKLNIAPASLTTVTVDLPDEVVAGKTVKAAVSGQGKGASVSYQWYFGADPIPGATKSSYKPAAADWGKTLRVAVAVAKPGYLGTYGQHTAGSVLLTYKAPKPKIVYTGTLTAGTELSVNAGTWNPEPIVAEQYQWLVGKTVVGTSPTYTVQPADKGKKITVKVTVPADSGYAALTVTSKATGKVK